MRALLTPEIAPRMGIVLFRPGSELMPLFMQGRVLLEPEPERYSSFASGAVPAASQPLADDPAVRAVFRNEAVIRRAGGVECLESWLLREKGCQWPHSDWHSENMTTMRHAPGAIRLCWHCDNQLRDQFTERLESMATDNCARWVLSVVRRDLGFDDSHVVTMPELCWWLIRNDLADALPESAARKALRLPKPVVPSVTRESDLVPSVPATSIIQDKAKKVLALKVDPESPESFMLRPKRRRWVNEKYTRWVKTQPCACCGKPADDPHHLIGHGQGGMGTKAHDLFVLPLCRKHHDELHAESRPGKSQDRAAVKVLQQFKDDITSGPNDLRLARENRTDLRKRFMASSDTVDKDTLQKASDIIYKAYTADMKKAVAKNLGADEAINMARVDRSWSKFNDMMGRTRVQKAIASGKATPEDVTKLVFSQSPSERSQLYRLLDDNGRQNARAAIVQNAVDKATDPSGNISVEKFINALHRNRKQSATFFKGVHGKELDGVIKYLNDTRHAAKANVQNLNGQQLYGLLVGGGIINAAVLAGMLKTAAFVVPAAGAVGGAAKAYESPVIRNALLRLANTPKGSTAYDRAISTVTQSLTTAAQASQKEAQ
ncbi:DUF968 domain-containing protein [Escherichia coli]|nr:DUF968 domain-containing protein [Escherichia coli]